MYVRTYVYIYKWNTIILVPYRTVRYGSNFFFTVKVSIIRTRVRTSNQIISRENCFELLMTDVSLSTVRKSTIKSKKKCETSCQIFFWKDSITIILLKRDPSTGKVRYYVVPYNNNFF